MPAGGLRAGLVPLSHPDPIDRDPFVPADTTTQLVVRRGSELLLVRAPGSGRLRAPGGRVRPGETPLEAAVRAVREGVGALPTGVRPRGELRLRFTDGGSVHCHVFAADGCDGEVGGGSSQWVPVDGVPYDEVDPRTAARSWLPRMLAGWGFDGAFGFDGDTLRWSDLRLADPGAPALSLLAALGVVPHTVEHAPVFTVAQARAARVDPGGVHVRNLFLRDKRGAMWLVTLPEDEPADLRALAATLGARHLSFGSADRLRTHLGVEPGSVTPLAAITDRQGAVTVAVSAAVLEAPLVHVHPLTNDRTTPPLSLASAR